MGRYNEDVFTCLNCGKNVVYEPDFGEEIEAECYYCNTVHVVTNVRTITIRGEVSDAHSSVDRRD